MARKNRDLFLPSGLKCPLCGSELGFLGCEFLCQNPHCKWDKTPDDFLRFLKEGYGLEEI